jgi:hypothetical protein
LFFEKKKKVRMNEIVYIWDFLKKEKCFSSFVITMCVF